MDPYPQKLPSFSHLPPPHLPPLAPIPTLHPLHPPPLPAPPLPPARALAKPKKLHREVEQKRRMRMAAQILELRKWVSDPAGKTDKVSVLQDAVAFVKHAAGSIQQLNTALEESREEVRRLRRVVEMRGGDGTYGIGDRRR